MKIISKLCDILPLLEDRGAIAAMFNWPRFSFTSYKMVSSLVKQSVSPITVIDVGANIGQFAIAAAKLFPGATVYSFEPHTECFKQLEKNTSNLKNIIAYPFALGDSEHDATLHLNSHSHSSSLLLLAEAHQAAFPQAREVAQIPVKVTTLDKIMGDIDLAPPVLLKLDVQGYEAQVLKGAKNLLAHIDFVILEASMKRMYEGETLFVDIMRLMQDYGFSFLRPVGWLADPRTGEILQLDALFAKTP